MDHIRIIDILIRNFNYSTYLEIGCDNDACFNATKIKHKVGVDPERGGTHRMTSDKFFEHNKEKFDIIFIDGLHHAEQVYKDFQNSWRCLQPGGTIVFHDCCPDSQEMQDVPRKTKIWTGDCWKAWVRIRAERDDIYSFCISTDFGVGILQKGHPATRPQIPDTGLDLKYNDLVKNKKAWLGLVAPEDFIAWVSSHKNKMPKNGNSDSIILYCANFGGHDTFKDLGHQPGIKAIYFTDNEQLHSNTWDIRVVKKNDMPARKLARYYKTIPHSVLPAHAISVWIDASFSIKPRCSIAQMVEQNFRSFANIMQYRHGSRDSRQVCAYREAKICAQAGLDEPKIIREQVKIMKLSGFPHDYGLFSTGFIIRRNNAQVNKFNEFWWQQIDRYSVRDQISQQYAAWSTGQKICSMSAGSDIYINPYILYHKHRRNHAHR